MINIRPYDFHDIESITHLMSDLGYPTNVDTMKQRMEVIKSEPNYFTFVSTIDDKVVGMIGIRQVYTYEGEGSATQISALVVDKRYEGRGIGTALIKYIEDWARENNSNSLYLTSGIRPERLRAHEFYKKQGFEITGYRFVKKLE